MRNTLPTKQELTVLRRLVTPTKLRLAVVKTEETFEGIIVIPQNRVQHHRLGVVVAVGSDAQIGASEGDIIIYQVNDMFEAGVTHVVDDIQVLFMHKGDAIGKVSSRTVSIDSFTVLGDYVLVEEIRKDKIGMLYLPDTATAPPEHVIVQLGSTVIKDDDPVISTLKVGDLVFVDRVRSTPIRLGAKTYHYVPKGWVQGKKS